MDEVTRTCRNVETGVRKAVRGLDGTDLKDRVGNAGDDVRKDIGNAGDAAAKAGRGPVGSRGNPASSSDRPT